MFMSGLSRLSQNDDRTYIGVTTPDLPPPTRAPSVPVGPYGPYPYPQAPTRTITPSGPVYPWIPSGPAITTPRPIDPGQRARIAAERAREAQRQANVHRLANARITSGNRNNFSKWVLDNKIWIGDTSAYAEAKQRWNQQRGETSGLPTVTAVRPPRPPIPPRPAPPPKPTIESQLIPPPRVDAPPLMIEYLETAVPQPEPEISEGAKLELARRHEMSLEVRKEVIKAEATGRMIDAEGLNLNAAVARGIQETVMYGAFRDQKGKGKSDEQSAIASRVAGNEFKRSFDRTKNISRAIDYVKDLKDSNIIYQTSLAKDAGVLGRAIADQMKDTRYPVLRDGLISAAGGLEEALSLFGSDRYESKSAIDILSDNPDFAISVPSPEATDFPSTYYDDDSQEVQGISVVSPVPDYVGDPSYANIPGNISAQDTEPEDWGELLAPPAGVVIPDRLNENVAPKIIFAGDPTAAKPITQTVADVVKGINEGADLGSNLKRELGWEPPSGEKFIVTPEVSQRMEEQAQVAAQEQVLRQEQSLTSLQQELRRINAEISRWGWQSGGDFDVDQKMTGLYRDRRNTKNAIGQAKMFLQSR